MSSSDSKALSKRNASTALMPPPPAPKRIKRPAVVLDEDTYTSAVAHIVRRDFFPGLAETDAQREYLNALDSKDKGWIREAGRKLTDVMTPVPERQRKAQERKRIKTEGGFGAATPMRRGGETPGATPKVWGNDTPVTVAGSEVDEDEEAEKKPEVDLSLSLSAFQAKYISEDQESFSKIIDRQNAAKFAKSDWARNGNMYASKQRIAQQKVIEAAQTKAIISASDSRFEPKAIGTGTDVILRPSQNLDDRPAGVNAHKHTPFNSLMFAPESIEDWAPTRSQQAEIASLAPPKQTLHHNTRMPVPDAEEIRRPPSPTMSAVRDAIHGRPRLNQSEGGFTGSETPRVNGYAFVDAHPPDPDDDEDDAPTDLLERLGAKSDPSPFTINDPQRRERLHHKMVEKIGNNRSASGKERAAASGSGLGLFGNDTPRFLTAPTPGGRAGMTPGPRKNVGNLTPAAQRLFERMGGGTKRSTGEGGFGGGREWTPTPRVKRRT